MEAVIGQILGNAVGVAISPGPIIAVILMLFSTSARRNSVAFLLGWIAGIAGVGAIVLLLGIGGSSDDSSSGGWIKIVIGILFIALAAKQWIGRPADGEVPPMPSWMAAVDGFSAPRAFGLALLLAAVNPKNLGLTLAAATTIEGAGLDDGQQLTALLVFVLVASSTILVPVVGSLLLGKRLTPTLTTAKTWLSANNATVMIVLFVVLGAKLIGDGISIAF
jgi:threonine/homoserine/homoserine lactone efflux protein